MHPTLRLTQCALTTAYKRDKYIDRNIRCYVRVSTKFGTEKRAKRVRDAQMIEYRHHNNIYYYSVHCDVVS
jgi:hypothetical protein